MKFRHHKGEKYIVVSARRLASVLEGSVSGREL